MLILSAVFSVVALALPRLDDTPVDFAKDVKPILDSRCASCHGEKKQKGKLRVDQWESVFTPAKKKPRVVAGKPDESPLYKLTTLPKDDPDVMPAEGDLLTADQIATLKRWIEQGATWPGHDAKATTAPEPKPEPKVEANAPTPDPLGLAPLPESAHATEKATLDKLTDRGALALKVAANSAGVEVNFSLLGAQANDADLALLAGLEPDLVWLNLARTAITDEGVKALAKFPELRRLNLSNTAITNAALDTLGSLGKLEYLNLYGTKVDDAGLQKLGKLGALRDLYLWQSGATDAGVAALQSALPNTRIDRGVYVAAKVVPIEPPAAENAAQPKKPVNSICPVSGKPVDVNVTSDVGDKAVAFCCANCKGEFDKDPSKFTSKLPELGGGAPSTDSVLGGELTDIAGNKVDLASFRGKVVLVVNPALSGNFVSQLAGLEKLYTERKDKGFVVLALPTADFGNATPFDSAAIDHLLRKQFKTTFPTFARGSIHGDSPTAQLFDRLSKAATQAPSWNFAKYLVGKDGKTVHYFAPKCSPTDSTLVSAIDEALR